MRRTRSKNDTDEEAVYLLIKARLRITTAILEKLLRRPVGDALQNLEAGRRIKRARASAAREVWVPVASLEEAPERVRKICSMAADHYGANTVRIGRFRGADARRVAAWVMQYYGYSYADMCQAMDVGYAAVGEYISIGKGLYSTSAEFRIVVGRIVCSIDGRGVNGGEGVRKTVRKQSVGRGGIWDELTCGHSVLADVVKGNVRNSEKRTCYACTTG